MAQLGVDPVLPPSCFVDHNPDSGKQAARRSGRGDGRFRRYSATAGVASLELSAVDGRIHNESKWRQSTATRPPRDVLSGARLRCKTQQCRISAFYKDNDNDSPKKRHIPSGDVPERDESEVKVMPAARVQALRLRASSWRFLECVLQKAPAW